MATLTEQERIKIGKWLDQLNSYEQQRVLSSQEAFEIWLYDKSYEIYQKVKDWFSDLWGWLFG